MSRGGGTPVAAWFAAQSFHGSAAHARPAQTLAITPPVDTRPRRDYLLPSGELVTIILDHGDTPSPTITYALKGGKIVHATLAPIQRTEIEALLAYAVEHNQQTLRYRAADALGIERAGCEPLSPDERGAVIRACATDLEMLRCMGVRIGGGLDARMTGIECSCCDDQPMEEITTNGATP